MTKSLQVLGIESSCDETGVVFDKSAKLLSPGYPGAVVQAKKLAQAD